jgi:hypothetical protein
MWTQSHLLIGFYPNRFGKWAALLRHGGSRSAAEMVSHFSQQVFPSRGILDNPAWLPYSKTLLSPVHYKQAASVPAMRVTTEPE